MNLFKTWFAAALAVGLPLAASIARADDAPPVETKAAAPQADVASKAAADAASEAQSAATQRRIDAELFIRFMQRFPSGVDVAKELKVTEEQTAKLRTVLDRIDQGVRAGQQPAMFRAGGFGDKGQALKRTEELAGIYERGKSDISNVLSAEQFARAQQIELQSRIRSTGMRRALEVFPAFEKMGLSPDQIAKLKGAEVAAQEQFQKESDALRDQQRQRLAEARKKVLGVLTPEQQAQYEKLVGNPIRDDESSLDAGVAGQSVQNAKTREQASVVRGFGSTPSARGGFSNPPGGFGTDPIPSRRTAPQNKP